MPTLLEVLRLSTSFLAQRGSESARLDAELVTAHSLGLRRLDLYLQFDRPLREEELEPMRALLRRRAAGEPVAYLVGEREFYGRPFLVTPAVLIPRPDTETLVEAALAWARVRAADGGGLRIADVGTGSGCIGITMAAELPGASVVVSDVSPEALEVARHNIDRTRVGERVETVQGDWTTPLARHAPFDMLLSNPPYVTTAEVAELATDVRNYEPHQALDAGDDGLHAYRALLSHMATLLRSPAYVAVEVDPRRADQVAQLLGAALPGWDVRSRADLTGRPRVIEALSST
ncbi:MAG TPA: peptide chain release factor N(5)-glutamine methyltransferase [Candidatus Dormibacteraeota bacterium]|nr:peptide chain release factor N(5)-glutamine methyltransferase [Candidatus Dormibacteraeota bacterium]